MENNLLKTSEMKFESHISFIDKHIKNYSCLIEMNGHELNGKKIIVQAITPKNENGEFLKCKYYYKLSESNKFLNGLDKFLNHYGFSGLNQDNKQK
jgi:hypothetical protein